MSRIRRLRRRLLVGSAVMIASLAGGASPAAAHADVDFTLPTDGATIGEPLTEITIGFTEPVTLVGPGFEVLSPQGELVQPFAVTDDDAVFRLQIDPPMGGGEVGVRYEVTSQDGHVISGSFSFTVSVDAPAPATTAPATTPPPTSAPEATAPPADTTPSPTEPVAPPSTAGGAVATTVAADEPDEATASPAQPAEAAATDVAVPGDDDEGSNTGLFIAIAAGVAIAAGAFLVFRRQSAS